ncbi:hypothetical protein ACFY0Z_30965 [Streptomyces kronopolitis]|uniref:MmyB family transcriptional regulator n=1 Tax=Streptomyces kronopolitis TaxID=1612435 RepID=UPI003685E736
MATRKDLLKDLLVQHRQRGDPRDLGWKPKPGIRPGRHRTRIAAELLAKELGVSKPYYLDIENSVRQAEVEELEHIAVLLKMTWRARAALFRRALGCVPMTPHPEVPAPVLHHDRLQEQPTCLTDLAYNVLDHNALFAALLPRVANSRPASPRRNLMRATLLHPRAGMWRGTEWAQELAAELLEAVAMHPDNAELQQLHAEAAAHEQAGPIYAEASRYEFPDREGNLLLSHTLADLGVRHLTLIGG